MHEPLPEDLSAADGTDRSELIRAFTTAGWLAFVCWLGFLFWVIGRVVRVGEQRFGGVWEQRIEVMSFILLPPNALILVPAAILACLAAWMSGPAESLSLAVLLRMVTWAAITQVGVGVLSIMSILFTETGSPTEAQDLAQRVAGICMMSAITIVTRALERTTPGGTS